MKMLIALSCITLLAGPALADWQPADGHKMHFPQLPDEDGWDLNTTFPMCLSDDWQCSETGLVKDIHFWGSWKNGVEGEIIYFNMAIHANLQVGHPDNPHPYSIPGETLWMATGDEPIQVVQISDAPSEGWYDPRTGVVLEDNHTVYYQYNVTIPEDNWFSQETGTVYWLDICANVAEPLVHQWGWKTADVDSYPEPYTGQHFMDDAVWIAETSPPDWHDIFNPANPLEGTFFVTFNQGGMIELGLSGGDGYTDVGGPWYEYAEWWNQWWFDHPYDDTRLKVVGIEFDVVTLVSGQPANLELTVNWSTDAWLPGTPNPPLPPITLPEEELYIGRVLPPSVVAVTDEVVHYVLYFDLRDYNPEWVSVDVRGENFVITNGFIRHDCVQQSLDLAFVITGEPPAPPPIPTVSEWGLIIMTLLLLTAGTVVFARRRRPAAA